MSQDGKDNQTDFAFDGTSKKTSTKKAYVEVNEQELLQLAQLINRTIIRQKKILFVMGAGASRSAGVPVINDIYRNLLNQTKETLKAQKEENSGKKGVDEQISSFWKKQERLSEKCIQWLTSLANNINETPRGVASLVLGEFQRAAENENIHLAEIWKKFSQAFISNDLVPRDESTAPQSLDEYHWPDSEEYFQFKPVAEQFTKTDWYNAYNSTRDKQTDVKSIRDLSPTAFHYFVAALVLMGKAEVISLNYDGLTHKALLSLLNNGDNGKAIIINSKTDIETFCLGDDSADAGNRLHALIKVWGDVFHVVCRNPRCPDHNKRTPIFELDVDHDPESVFTCTCGGVRQLEIYFTGYEKKEQNTREIMDTFLRYFAPKIGCVITAGFSGLWDTELMDCITTVCDHIKRDNYLSEAHLNDPTCFCIDPATNPFVVAELKRRDVPVCHVRRGCDDVAIRFKNGLSSDKSALAYSKELIASQAHTKDSDKYDIRNKDCLVSDKVWSKSGSQIVKCFDEGNVFLSHVYNDIYSRQTKQKELFLDKLQQLALKAKIISHDPDAVSAHTRQNHSLGTLNLACSWFSILVDDNEKNRKCSLINYARTYLTLASYYHDFGHIPFSHMAEEIFAELSWSISDWGRNYKHDEPVLLSSPPIAPAQYKVAWEKSVIDLTRKAAGDLSIQEDFLRREVESYLQGNSGQPWVNAILNSPLDVDKLDYVFRDCRYLRQGLHIDAEQADQFLLSLFHNSHIIPSGLLALKGDAGDNARIFLEERLWLYRNQYCRRSFRAIERLARWVVLKWFLQDCYDGINEQSQTRLGLLGSSIQDTRALKGRHAKTKLWQQIYSLDPKSQEPQLLISICDDLVSAKSGLAYDPRVINRVKACKEIWQKLQKYNPDTDGSLSVLLHEKCEVTMSECLYVPVSEIDTVRNIIRKLETEQPYGALGDISIPPRALSYPSSQEFGDIIGESIVVSHYDPERWGLKTNKWVPLSETYYAKLDKERWAKIMFVAPDNPSPEVSHMLDRFKNECRHLNIAVKGADPQRNVLHDD